MVGRGGARRCVILSQIGHIQGSSPSSIGFTLGHFYRKGKSWLEDAWGLISKCKCCAAMHSSKRASITRLASRSRIEHGELTEPLTSKALRPTAVLHYSILSVCPPVNLDYDGCIVDKAEIFWVVIGFGGLMRGVGRLG